MTDLLVLPTFSAADEPDLAPEAFEFKGEAHA